MRPAQVGLFPSGKILLLARDTGREQTHLIILDQSGSIIHDIALTANDPAPAGAGGVPLVNTSVLGWNGDLVIVPDDIHRSLLEVSESGAVQAISIHIPKGYEGGVPMSFEPSGWFFTMERQSRPQASNVSSTAEDAQPVSILEFDPISGNAVRQFDLVTPGFQPACENGGKFSLLGARKGDGKLQLATDGAHN